MSIRNHKLWPEIAKCIKIEIYAPDGGYKKPRFRIEFNKDVTPSQKELWTKLEVPCVACGKSVHPIRERKPGGRKTGRGHLYFAPCCPLDVNLGCSRGNAAHSEYLAIRQQVEALNPHSANLA